VAFALLAGCQEQAADETAATPVAAQTTALPAPADSAAAGTAASQSAPVCAAGETPIFACTFPDRKRLAVCGTAPGKAEYRFGGETSELVLSGGERATVPYSGGGESQLAFTNGVTRYIVFSRMVRTGFDEQGNEPAISDGVVVLREGKFVAIKVCEDPDVKPVDVNAAETFLAQGKVSDETGLFTEETMRADPPGDE
jgi:hypothetical protein